MWGNKKLDSNDTQAYSKLNAAQSSNTTAASVWKGGPKELQTYVPPITNSSDTKSVATVKVWRLANNQAHFKIE